MDPSRPSAMRAQRRNARQSLCPGSKIISMVTAAYLIIVLFHHRFVFLFQEIEKN
jgi:hypothetical protein